MIPLWRREVRRLSTSDRSRFSDVTTLELTTRIDAYATHIRFCSWGTNASQAWIRRSPARNHSRIAGTAAADIRADQQYQLRGNGRFIRGRETTARSCDVVHRRRYGSGNPRASRLVAWTLHVALVRSARVTVFRAVQWRPARLAEARLPDLGNQTALRGNSACDFQLSR